MLNWEEVKQNTSGILYRVQLCGGWLVKEVQDVCQYDGIEMLAQGYSWTTSITFVPDPEHKWIIE